MTVPRLLAACLLAALLSGCTAATPAGPTSSTDPCLVVSARDDSCLEKDRAAAPGAATPPHKHDYWGGKDRLVLKDVSVQAGSFLCTDVASVAVLRPADGESIVQGAATVEATLSWTTDPTDIPGATEFWLKTAADDSAKPVGPVESGQKFILPTDDGRSDLPHQQLSAWEFHLAVRPSSPSGCFRHTGTATLHLELTRGAQEIPLYPGHPDRWAGALELALVDEARQVSFYQGDTGGTCLDGPMGGDCLWTPHAPASGSVVPYDAARVRVTVTAEGASPLRLKLAYHGADVRTLTLPDAALDSGQERVYDIPVDKNGDGPYAKQSQWQFWLLPDNAAQFYDGGYRITVVAQKA